MSWLAWLLMLLYAFAPLCYLCGRFPPGNWLVVLINLVFCVLVIRARGNVSKSLYYEGADMKSKDEILTKFWEKRAVTSITRMIKVVRLNGASLKSCPCTRLSGRYA